MAKPKQVKLGVAYLPWQVSRPVQRALEDFLGGRYSVAVLPASEILRRFRRWDVLVMVPHSLVLGLRNVPEAEVLRERERVRPVLAKAPSRVIVLSTTRAHPAERVREAFGYWSKSELPNAFSPQRVRLLHEGHLPSGEPLYVVGYQTWWGEGHGNLSPIGASHLDEGSAQGRASLQLVYEAVWQAVRPAKRVRPIAPIPSSHVPLLALGGFFPRQTVETSLGRGEVVMMPRRIEVVSPPATDFVATKEGMVTVTVTRRRTAYTLEARMRLENKGEVTLL